MSLLFKILMLIMTILQMFQNQLGIDSGRHATDLNSPTIKAYSKGQWKARSVWDMVLDNGVLYVGSGDYGTNAGPVDIWAYDIGTEEWSSAQTVNGEAISRFVSLEDKIVAPGIDPRSSWEYGDYYILSQGQWRAFDQLPLAVHNFDIASFGGRMFFGLGTEDDLASPVLVSENGTSDFTQVPFYKNDAPVLGNGDYSFTRVYDFFVLEDTLYCLFAPCREDTGYSYEIYRFTGERFEFVSNLKDAQLHLTAIKQVPIAGKVCVGKTCYIACGNLYTTSDFVSFTQVQLPNGGYVTDLLTEPVGATGLEVVYVLSSAATEDGNYRTTIYALAPDGTAVPLVEYTASCLALSFVKAGNGFYVGFGFGNEKTRDVGKVIYITIG